MSRGVAAALIAGITRRDRAQVEAGIAARETHVQVGIVGGTLASLFLASLAFGQFGLFGLLAFLVIVILIVD